MEETPHGVPTKVSGKIPPWIRGRLLRNGPGKFEFGDNNFNHWFDGSALLHSFTIQDGSVTYLSKFLRSQAYLSNQSQQRIVMSEFGTLATPDPCKSLFQRFVSTFQLPDVSDNANVNFVRYKKDYCVSTETDVMHKVDPATLQTEDQVRWSNYIAVNGATAHPHYDPCGTTYNMGNSYGKHGTFYNIIKVPAQESDDEVTLRGAEVVCAIPARDKWNPSYYHSFAMTENFVVFIEQPIRMNLLRILTSKITGCAVADCLSWDPTCDTIFHVANKHTGQLHTETFHADARAMFHQINAYEEEGCIVLDLCCQDNGDVLQMYTLQNLRQSGQALDEVYNSVAKSFPRRFVLPLHIDTESPQHVNLNPLLYTTATATNQEKGKVRVTPENLYSDAFQEVGSFEFPAINYSRYNTKKYRFFYGCGMQHLVGSSLIKMDVGTKEMKIWQEDGLYPSEPVFVPRPDSDEEDDGVILSAVVTPRQDKSTFLLVLDAKSFTEIARAEIPVQMPYGFHGIFLPDQ